MSPESLIISESGALLWFIRIHQRFWGWSEISCPLLLPSPPLCPPPLQTRKQRLQSREQWPSWWVKSSTSEGVNPGRPTLKPTHVAACFHS